MARKTSSKKKATKKPSKKSAKKKATAKRPSKKKVTKKPANAKTGRGHKGEGAETPAGTQQFPFEGDDTQVDMLYPAGTIADMLGITDRHLRRLAEEGIVPKATRGRYPIKGCVQGYITYLQALRVSTDERSGEATRLSKVRADTYELELQIKKQQLYKREVIDQALFKVCAQLTAMLDGTASRIASQLGGGAALRKRLVEEFYEIRSQFAAGLREFSEHLRADGWNDRPTARRRARKVGKRKPRTTARKRRARSV